MPATWRSEDESRQGGLFWLTALLLVMAFITGGSSQESGWGQMLAEVLALITLVWIALSPSLSTKLLKAKWPLAVAGLILTIPLLQLLPLSESLWHSSALRLALAEDLRAAGVTVVDRRWSLAPAATERELLALLPGLAVFTSALALGREAWKRLLWLLVALILFSLLLAFVQLATPQDSIFNPFPQWAPALGGVFANQNHQACALAMLLVLTASKAFDAWRYDRSSPKLAIACAIVAIIVFAILPLLDSRAGVVIGILAIGLTYLASPAASAQVLRERPAARWLMVAVAVATVILASYGAVSWMHYDAETTEGSRTEMVRVSAELARASMPWGNGVGSFVPLFEQATQGSLMSTGYINAAHNDYVQWWFEGGVLALMAVVSVLAALLITALRLRRLPRDSGLRHVGMTALITLLVPVIHSTVDYPLRTQTLMTSFGLLAGIAVACAAKANARRSNAQQRVPS